MDDQRQGHSEIGQAATCSDSQTGWVDGGSPEAASENFASYQKDQARPSHVGHSVLKRRQKRFDRSVDQHIEGRSNRRRRIAATAIHARDRR